MTVALTVLATIAVAQTIALVAVTRAFLGSIRELSAQAERQEIRGARERSDLLQRIQSPEQAIVTHATQSAAQELVLPVAFDDDDDAYEAVRAARGEG